MLYNRVASLVIGTSGGKGRELRNLRFSFAIQKGSTKTPNKCTVRIYNAAVDTRRLIEVIGNVLILKAGYSEDVGEVTIFTGNVIRSLTVKDGPDWITEIEMQDGFLEFRDAKVSVSLAAGATTQQVIQAVVQNFALPVRPFPSEIASKQYAAGFAFVGRVRDAMDKACSHMGLEWSIQNRQVQIIPKGGVLKQKALVLSSSTGMIGSPAQESQTMTERAAAKIGVTSKQPGVRRTTELDKDGNMQEMLQVFGYKVTTLLQPNLEPGGFVRVESAGIDKQFFRIEEINHAGDTHGNEWASELTLRFV
jgi:hypothetical protein